MNQSPYESAAFRIRDDLAAAHRRACEQHRAPALPKRLGTAALVDAAAVVANFNAIDRIADATGIPIDAQQIELTADLRAELGIDVFAEDRL